MSEGVAFVRRNRVDERVALGIAVISLDPPRALFAIFCLYGVSGYAVYAWRRAKGLRASVIATSTDDPDEKGLHP